MEYKPSETNITQSLATWNPARLKEVLVQNDSSEKVNHDTLYRLLGVRLAGNGPFLREEKLGQQIQATRLSKVHAGHFIYSRLFAWRGAFGVIPNELDGAYVSNEFPTFSADRALLDVDFLRLYFLQRCLWSEVEAHCTGTTKLSRNRFKEEFFLEMEVPLPPLDEQRRIVSRVETIAGQLRRAVALREETLRHSYSLLGRVLDSVFSGMRERVGSQPLGRHVKIQGGFAFRSEEYLSTGLPIVRIANLEDERVHVKGSPCIEETRFKEFERFALKPTDILIALTGATTGKLGIVPEGCDKWLLNQRVGRFVVKSPLELEAKYIYWLARGVQRQIFGAAYGGAQPNISPGDIEAMLFPFPDISEQRRTVALLDDLQSRVDSLKKLQTETAAELGALMPSILSKAFRGEL